MALIITFLAGFSTMLGYFFIYLRNTSNNLIIKSLSFSSGVMFIISVIDLIPNSFKEISRVYYIIPSILFIFLFIMIGFIISYYFNKLLPDSSDSLYKVGFISMVAIIIHNIPEGIITYLTTNYNLKMGISLAIAIAFHNIPEGISISIPIFLSTMSKKKTFMYVFIAGISEFIGALFSFLFLNGLNSGILFGFLYSFIAGLMLYISLFELLPKSFSYKKYYSTIVYFMIGIIFMLISIIILG